MGRFRERFPTPEEIQATADGALLDRWLAYAATERERIEASLDHRDGDADWRARATNALALARRTVFLIDRRIKRLGASERQDGDCSPLTLALMETYPRIAPATCATAAEAEEMAGRLSRMIAAAEEDRADEIGLPGPERDQSWLGRVAVAIREGRRLRLACDDRLRLLRKQDARTHHDRHEERRERLFIEAVRQTHTRDEFLALWARVDAMELVPFSADVSQPYVEGAANG